MSAGELNTGAGDGLSFLSPGLVKFAKKSNDVGCVLLKPNPLNTLFFFSSLEACVVRLRAVLITRFSSTSLGAGLKVPISSRSFGSSLSQFSWLISDVAARLFDILTLKLNYYANIDQKNCRDKL